MDVKIKLGETYALRFDFNAAASFEEAHGQTLMNVIASGNLGFLSIRNMIWAALLSSLAENGSRLTPIEIGELLQIEWFDKDKSFSELTTLVISSMRESGLIPKVGNNKKKPAESKKSKTRKST